MDTRPSDPTADRCPDMAHSYDAYFRTGLYETRYPGPNRRTLRHALSCLPRGGRFLDYGAGTGRYTLPLLTRRPDVSGVAADISAVARETLTRRADQAGLASRLSVIDGAPGVIEAAAEDGPFDLCLLAFGVLGHVMGHDNRVALQQTLRRALKPDGVLLIGLPNARRRLRAEQRATRAAADPALEPGDVLYARHADDGDIPLYYHVYTPAEIVRDLRDSGFAVRWLGAESLLPESLVCRVPGPGLLDDWACRLLPPDWAYGFLVVATPNAQEG
jgi:SAM-dependent methyltransferase